MLVKLIGGVLCLVVAIDFVLLASAVERVSYGQQGWEVVLSRIIWIAEGELFLGLAAGAAWPTSRRALREIAMGVATDMRHDWREGAIGERAKTLLLPIGLSMILAALAALIAFGATIGFLVLLLFCDMNRHR